jgi:hypothetical protein
VKRLKEILVCFKSDVGRTEKKMAGTNNVIPHLNTSAEYIFFAQYRACSTRKRQINFGDIKMSHEKGKIILTDTIIQ